MFPTHFLFKVGKEELDFVTMESVGRVSGQLSLFTAKEPKTKNFIEKFATIGSKMYSPLLEQAFLCKLPSGLVFLSLKSTPPTSRNRGFVFSCLFFSFFFSSYLWVGLIMKSKDYHIWLQSIEPNFSEFKRQKLMKR